MKTKTQAVVLHYIKYKETSIIVHVFTEEFGYQSLIVNGVRTSSSKTQKIGLYQPLNLLEVVLYYKEAKTIHRLAEARISHPTPSISSNFVKTSIGLFISEVLYNTLKEESDIDESMYVYIERSIRLLDGLKQGIENFHLYFISGLSSYLGIAPLDYEDFSHVVYSHLSYQEKEKFEPVYSKVLEGVQVELSGKERNKLLDLWLRYYEKKAPWFKYPKSLDILREVFA